MFNSKNKKYLLIIIILFAIDQITKKLVLNSNKTINLGILELNEVHNTGASFGIFQGSNLSLALVSILVLIAITYYFKQIEQENRIATAMITGGILGNLMDRLIYGHVIDFIDFRWWPVFNFADTCIVLGVIWIGINTFRNDKKKTKLKKKSRK